MQVTPTNFAGRYVRILPPEIEQSLSNVYREQGSQIIRVPVGSTIKNITLQGGASHNSRWACLRGAVIKFAQEREAPIHIDGRNFVVPSGHVLMDYQSYLDTKNRNNGKEIPHKIIKDISPEDLFLVHASYSHPDQLFLPQGTYTETTFISDDIPFIGHMNFEGERLYLVEQLLPVSTPYNILEGLSSPPISIIVQLSEGGHVCLV
ncbi:hypothetical protein A2526_02870 [candidate division WOR-1 bacterium RIFOXYD2_FULL_36_8]|uniref:Uncharacterized protein n=1 Tax=candidate division WOR-1 bacterium RIFOXYB2_FULL_36_35 TaxID=1802578 RepID=A0A1F4S0U9_UNCSA|nr:MAG: hypothetical protein A2230_06620 [candidate division WOR-1 bacterium RIFOXYA2_FULL_36_21]OGC14017.1 MAG: hypothetical protein A2290_02375 [candidate division WOR-1 bacterium RIFOXYB2_FULL_36_35]OGC14952.1 MAG: hypothetical protein A2282_06910 [candidate division WOR-1 bacterium RIFOXYA12_FULL_36_13]OGC37547.1 MAG: hypothetical protein A2526_02870 [candidate division WOR-1 bacterium RIFOXYD2_FULL_36_8]